ncbi:MAG: MerR family transcriptional regulator [Planctomycetota bacterium]
MSDAAKSKPSELLKTGAVLERAGISRQVLYRYIQLDLVQPAETTDTGRHRFRESVFKQIDLIQKLNERYTLRDIREIFSERLRKLS